MPKPFYLDIKPYLFQVSTDIDFVVENAKRVYGDRFSNLISAQDYVDYRLELNYPTLTRRIHRPQAQLFSEGREPFKPLPVTSSFAMLEWGMNWTIAMHEFQKVIVHSAVVAKDDKAILLPAPPGSGKSTTTAYLENNGWRLLSDEMALIDKETNKVWPFVRPICLKDRSIELCRNFFPDNLFSEVAKKTHKGDVAHMAPQQHSVDEDDRMATIVGIIFPKYDPKVSLDIYEIDKTSAMVKFTDNAFNFNLLGRDSFLTNAFIIENTKQYEIHFSDLSELNAFLTDEFCS